MSRIAHISRLAALGLLATLLASPSDAVAQDVTSAGDPPMVVAGGQGEVTLRPDRATVSVTIRTIAQQPDQAASRNLETAEAVTTAIEDLDLEPDSLRLTGVRIGPNREYTPEGPRDDGYFAERSLRVTTNDLSDVGRIIEAAVGAGATQIDHVAYSSTEETAARREALMKAVDKARGDAEAVAAAAGGRLGPVLLLSTQDVSVPRPMYRMEMASADAPRGGDALPEPEDLTVTAFVQAHWAFEAGER